MSTCFTLHHYHNLVHWQHLDNDLINLLIISAAWKFQVMTNRRLKCEEGFPLELALIEVEVQEVEFRQVSIDG